MKIPTHNEVARRAEDLWQTQGLPVGRDTDIWFEAERQLKAGRPGPRTDSTTHPIPPGNDPFANAVLTAAIRAKAGLAAARPTVSRPLPSTARATGPAPGQQVTLARTPKRPTKFAPEAAVPRSGKPLWSRSHSS